MANERLPVAKLLFRYLKGREKSLDHAFTSPYLPGLLLWRAGALRIPTAV